MNRGRPPAPDEAEQIVRLAPLIEAIVTRMFGRGLPPQIARGDLVVAGQRGVLAAARATTDRGAYFSNYVRRGIHSAIIDCLRQEMLLDRPSRPVLRVCFVELDAERLSASDERLDDRWLIGRMRDRLAEAFGKLPEREAELLAARYARGQTCSEVAVRLGISQARVSQLEKHALGQLRIALGGSS